MAEPGAAIKPGATPIDARRAGPHLAVSAPSREVTIMRLLLRIVLSALAFAPIAARAEEPPPLAAPDADRFSLQPVEGGFLRLDKETGAVSFCTAKDGVAACRLGAEERTALEAEIARLRQENARLKSTGLSQQKPSQLPSEQEFERAMSFTERFLRRIMRIFREEAPSGGGL